jgi:muconolactone D-isomerase
MQFLVQIAVAIPPDLADDRREELLAAERERGHELQAAGVIEQIWRVPGTTGNVGIWAARDATELHDCIASLPLFPWITAEVTALAVHPLDR